MGNKHVIQAKKEQKQNRDLIIKLTRLSEAIISEEVPLGSVNEEKAVVHIECVINLLKAINMNIESCIEDRSQEEA